MGKNKNRLPDNQSSTMCYFEPRTKKQSNLFQSIKSNEVTVAIGPAGTGKTYVALNAALQLLGKTYKHIYLVKSLTIMEGENPGYIKGGLDEKMEPVMISFTWTIDKILNRKNASKDLMHKGIIETLPLAYVRGISIDDSIVIIDEAQNLSRHAFKTIMTRIGENSKYVFLGDIDQIDRKKQNESCLEDVYDLFKDIELFGTIKFEDEDCVRNPIIPIILNKLKEKEF